LVHKVELGSGRESRCLPLVQVRKVAKIKDQTGLAQKILDEAAAWYASHTGIPKTFDKVDPRVMQKAMELAHGDIHRLIIEKDLAVTVANWPVWS
jgi:hypothetical protein